MLPVAPSTHSDMERLVEASNEFGRRISLSVLRDTKDVNVALSPAGCWIGLTLASCGASKGSVSSDMKGCLLHTQLGNEEKLVSALHKVFSEWRESEEQDLEISNLLATDMRVSPSFKELAAYLFAEIYEMPDPASLLALSAHCSKMGLSTRGGSSCGTASSDLSYDSSDEASVELPGEPCPVCDHLLCQATDMGSPAVSRGDVGTTMVLLSHVSFKCKWLHQFPIGDTRLEDFNLYDGSRIKVPMMRLRRKDFSYMEEKDKFQMIELEYDNPYFRAYVLLPAQETTLLSLVEAMTPSRWQIWRSQLRTCEGHLRMPRFRFASSRDLSSHLYQAGMKSAFATRDAFQRIGNNLHLDKVRHSSYVDVNESGTEARATTEIWFAKSALPKQEMPHFDMFVNRPFLFLITDVYRGFVMFLGCCFNPQQFDSDVSDSK